jgi:hypothetical protein
MAKVQQNQALNGCVSPPNFRVGPEGTLAKDFGPLIGMWEWRAPKLFN